MISKKDFTIIKDLRVLNVFKKYGLSFDKKFKYYIGDAYKTEKGLSTNQIFKHNNKNYELNYFDGCFNPFLCEVKIQKLNLNEFEHICNDKKEEYKKYD